MYAQKKTKQKRTKRTSFNMLFNMVATVAATATATATCCAHTLTEPNSLSLLPSPTHGMKLRYCSLCLSTFTSVRACVCMCVCVYVSHSNVWKEQRVNTPTSA